jgi:UDP-glucose 4-epimerase
MAEQLVTSYARQFGTSTAIVRFFSVYGSELRKQLLWDACRKFANRDDQFMGTGDEIRDWLHVEDASELLLTAAEHASPECPVVNGGSGKGITVREVLIHLGSCILRPDFFPSFTGVERPGNPTSYIADIEASMSWGWFPKISWEQGMREYAKWWLENRP